MELTELIKSEYLKLENKRKTTEFKKVDMHIHTPGSTKDYKVGNKVYEDIKIEEIKELCVTKGLYTQEELNNISKDKDDLMASLIIHEAYEHKKLDMFVITDHNNLEWYSRIIEAAIEYIKTKRNDLRKIEILPGVEITCFSGTHVIAILDNKKEKYKEQWNYIKYELQNNSEENIKGLFTSKSEMDVIYTIRKVGGLVYIPHIDNNANKFSIKDMLDPISGISKAQLFTSEYVHAIGFSNYSKFKSKVSLILNDKNHQYFRKAPLAYLQDSDSHSIDTIGTKPMYIKMERCSFDSLKFALEDPDVRVSFEKIETVDAPYIKGLISYGGFLSKITDSKYQSYYPFSNQFNCIIGGRGTGKSTLINCIKYCLEGKIQDINFRQFMGEFERILIYIYDGKDNYCIHCKPKIKKDNYTNKEILNSNQLPNALTDISGWITIYKLSPKSGNWNYQNIDKKNDVLENFYIDFFQQSEIYQIGENNFYILKLLESVMKRSKKKALYYEEKEKINIIIKDLRILLSSPINFKMATSIINKNNELLNAYYNLDKLLIDLVNEINSNMQKKVKLNYTREVFDIKNGVFNELEIFSKFEMIESNVTKHLEMIIVYLFDNFTLMELFNKLYENTLYLEQEIIKSNVITFERSEDISEFDIKEYFNKIKIIINRFFKSIINYDDLINISIDFNINSFDNIINRPNYKSIKHLSYGQKAVVILILITEGIAGLNINVPLIIDQPEDHLDNKYIYNDLVNNIRALKSERQIILVTHNANIPVCGDAENVMCLQSDNKSAWIELHGPLDNKDISKKIMTVMEGGEKSFEIRKKKYSSFSYI